MSKKTKGWTDEHGWYHDPDVPGVSIYFYLAQGNKCERCWKVLREVGTHSKYKDLCMRCVDAVEWLITLSDDEKREMGYKR
jgi:isoleucyl-tRNA synthetase